MKALAALQGVVARLPRPVLRALLRGFVRPGHDSIERARDAIREHLPSYDHPRGAAAIARQVGSLRTEDTLEIAPRLPELGFPAAPVWALPGRARHRTAAGAIAAVWIVPRHGGII